MSNNLSEETKTLLSDYFQACANLYGVIPLKSFLKIYNSQNEAVSEDDFIDFVENFDFKDKDLIDKDLAKEYCYIFGDWDGYIQVKESQFGIPYYVP